jgi:phosphoribosylglycinamide formyltransferase-1
MKNIAIFASGSGTNAENIVRHFRGSKEICISLVLSDNPNAFVLKRVERYSIPAIVFTSIELREGAVLEMLKGRGIDFIVLAGFLKLIPINILEAYPNGIVNIHPALLPKYGGMGMYGIRVHQSVIEGGEVESGITIHLVNAEYDKGDIIFQAKCPVLQCDKPETLAERIHQLEYEHYPSIVEELVKKI